ncbi:cytochrome P450 [Rhodococcus sp. NPDC003994]
MTVPPSHVTPAPTVGGVAALRYLVRLMGPAVLSGVILRQPATTALAQRWSLDTATGSAVRELRRRFGGAPVRLQVPGRELVIPVRPADVERVLAQPPEVADPANREKVGALGLFQPHGVLVSRGAVRVRRRDFVEDVLETDREMHSLAGHAVRVVDEEVAALLPVTGEATVTADEFLRAWWRVVRRITLGDSARDDEAVTDTLRRLRGWANWSVLAPRRRRLRQRLERDLYDYVDAAEPGSLAAIVARSGAGAGVDPVGQLPHWLFAFDAAGLAAVRALALLATHPEARERARTEATTGDGPRTLPYLRATILDSLRLWPTTPAILRDAARDLQLDGPDGTEGPVIVPKGSAVAVLASAFHRDPDLPFADRFAPEIWTDGTAEQYPQLVPFSAGPVVCPGQNLVLLVTSSLLAAVLRSTDPVLADGAPLSPTTPLPASLNPFGLAFGVTARPEGPTS